MTAVTAPECRAWFTAARQRACLSQAQLGERLDVSEKTVRRWERGESVPAIPKRAELARALGLTVDELNRQLGVDAAPGAAPVGNGNGAPFAAVTEHLSMHARAERTAHAIWTVVNNALPALAQTAGYARAVELSGYQGFGSDEVEHLVETRLDRAGVLGTTEYTALMPAWLLDAEQGGARVMAEQFAHLVDLADRPSVTLLLIEPRHLSSVPYNEFTLLGTAGPRADTVTEFAFGEPMSRHSPDVVADRVRAFEHLRSLALGAGASRAAIAKSADRYAALANMRGTPA